jgi:hypothetical protein
MSSVDYSFPIEDEPLLVQVMARIKAKDRHFISVIKHLIQEMETVPNDGVPSPRNKSSPSEDESASLTRGTSRDDSRPIGRSTFASSLRELSSEPVSLCEERARGAGAPGSADDRRSIVLQAILPYLQSLGIDLKFSLSYKYPGPDNEVTVLIYLSEESMIRLGDVDVGDLKVKFRSVSPDLEFEHQPDIGSNPPLTTDEAAMLRPILQEAQISFSDSHSNLVGVIGGHAYNSSGWSLEPQILVFLHHKGYIPLGEQPLPEKFKGINVRVYEGRYDKLSPKQEMEYSNPAGDYSYIDPPRPGISIGLRGSNSIGTLGGFLSDDKTNDIYIN